LFFASLVYVVCSDEGVATHFLLSISNKQTRKGCLEAEPHPAISTLLNAAMTTAELKFCQ
jgi:hypothetical protein